MSSTLLMMTPRPHLLQVLSLVTNCSECIHSLPLVLRQAFACMHQGQPSQCPHFTGHPSGSRGECHSAATQTVRKVSTQAALVVIQHLAPVCKSIVQ